MSKKDKDEMSKEINKIDWRKKDLDNLISNLEIESIDLDLDSFRNIRSKSQWLNNPSLEKQLSLQEEITDLRKKLKSTHNELAEVSFDKETKIKELDNLLKELQSKEKINHILPRICEEARQKLLDDENFKDLFKNARSCDSVVVSIDIRRSTELMLKARQPELFSKFITELSQKLSEVILSNYGVFDKFTGDGVLAFFPKFYTGESAIIYALKTANECHKVFEQHYKNSRECFNVFIKDIGLGIGVDYGNVTLVNTRNELTVVGIPVVYACRMSGAKAGQTLFNQPAKEEMQKISNDFLKVTEKEIDIKNEGVALAYEIELHNSLYSLEKPQWVKNEQGQ